MSRAKKFATFFGFNFASHQFEKFRVDLISRKSLKTAENDNFWALMESLSGLSTQNVISKIFARI